MLKTVNLFGVFPWLQCRRIVGKSSNKKTRFLGNGNGGSLSSCIRRSPPLHSFTPGPEDRCLLKSITPGPEDRRLLINQMKHNVVNRLSGDCPASTCSHVHICPALNAYNVVVQIIRICWSSPRIPGAAKILCKGSVPYEFLVC